MMTARPLIRIAMLLTAWCCGFLFYVLLGKTAGTDISQTGPGLCISDWWNNYANAMQTKLLSLPLRQETSGQILALTLGRREFLTPEIRQLYRTAGGSHLLALSGLHLGVIFSLLGYIIKNTVHGRLRWPVVCFSILMIWSYSFLTGCPKSLVRAAMMMTLALLFTAGQCDRKMIDILTLSASLIMLVDPSAAFDIGFQLSCTAMLGISLIAMPIINEMSDKCKWFGLSHWRKYLVCSLLVSFSAQLTTLPLILWYFHSITPYSALTSLVAIPLTTLIIYTSLPLYAGCTWLIPIVELLLFLQNGFMRLVGELPGAYIAI